LDVDECRSACALAPLQCSYLSIKPSRRGNSIQ
jgi:hypothetical protein